MAPLEWLTPNKTSDTLGTVAALLHLGLGIGSLYLGLTGPRDDVFFGVDAFIWIGIIWLLAGVYWWFSRSLLENVSKQDENE
jgi:high-affinity Fe2+/Pb2+ permease